mmetsp:Transcript_84504/g.242635  ORF Transcript_84504/g.242635 Transcript_84504/m.242635 type:complete len:132 (+) Transcript_84504:600-995(+)
MACGEVHGPYEWFLLHHQGNFGSWQVLGNVRGPWEFARGTINPIGFKIGLEIMVRCRCQRVQDVGIMFQERAAGESKLSAKHYKFYVQQLAALYWDKYMDYIFLVVLLVFGALILFTTWMPHQDTFNTMLR